MTESDKAVMRLALDALIGYKPQSLTHAKEQDAAVIALREAIAQPAAKVTCQTCEALARTVMMDQTYHDGIKGPK